MTSVCNARCAHCFYPINAGKNELTLDEIDKLDANPPAHPAPPDRRRRALPAPRPAGDHPPLLRAHAVLHLLDPDQRLRPRGDRASGARRSAASIPTSPSASRSRSTASATSTTVCRRCPASTTARSRRSRPCSPLARATPNLTVGVTTVFMRDNQKEFEEFCDFIYGTYRPHHHSLSLIRGEAYDPALKDNLDVDLYARLSRKARRALSAGRGPHRLARRAHAGAARGQPPALRVHRAAGARAAPSSSSASPASGSSSCRRTASSTAAS